MVPELEPREGEVVVDKIAMSAFKGTFLNLEYFSFRCMLCWRFSAYEI
jgi:hypothetical protein